MADYPSRYVVDTSLLIDLCVGKVIIAFFKLPYVFSAPDVIIAEQLMCGSGSRLPRNECRKRITQWLDEAGLGQCNAAGKKIRSAVAILLSLACGIIKASKENNSSSQKEQKTC